jgi:hypothetical protein
MTDAHTRPRGHSVLGTPSETEKRRGPGAIKKAKNGPGGGRRHSRHFRLLSRQSAGLFALDTHQIPVRVCVRSLAVHPASGLFSSSTLTSSVRSPTPCQVLAARATTTHRPGIRPRAWSPIIPHYTSRFYELAGSRQPVAPSLTCPKNPHTQHPKASSAANFLRCPGCTAPLDLQSAKCFSW